MGAWHSLAEASKTFLDQHGLLAAFLFLLIDEAGVPTPVPGNLLIVALGVRARQGAVALSAVVVAMEIATVIGATFLYGLSSWAGRRMVYRYGKYVGLTPERLRGAETWVRRHGLRAVILARLVPGLRIVTAVAAGVLSIPPSVFLPGMSVGALLYILACVAIGYEAGPPVLAWVERFPLPFGFRPP